MKVSSRNQPPKDGESNRGLLRDFWMVEINVVSLPLVNLLARKDRKINNMCFYTGI